MSKVVCVYVKKCGKNPIDLHTLSLKFRLLLVVLSYSPASREYLLCLLGKVDIDVHLALGYFQDTSDDLDVFNELAQFSTRLSIRDTSQVDNFIICGSFMYSLLLMKVMINEFD